MKKVCIQDNKVWVEGERAMPLLSGEVHFWRHDPSAWRPILGRLKEMGLEMAASYVCWDFHEIGPGRFDFSGQTDPRRDLSGFLNLVAKEGLRLIIRPGPYIYAEWRNHGLPDYAVAHHRLDPRFQELACRYMTAVSEILRPFLASSGGPIVMLQADNEIDAWPHWYGEQLGLGSVPGLYQEFLSQAYCQVQDLNQAWRTSYTSFEEARAVCAPYPPGPETTARYLDTVRFRHWYATRVAGWAAGAYRSLGIDVPILFNTYSGFGAQNWAALAQVGQVVGPDIYPSAGFAGRPQEHRTFLETVRYIRQCSQAAYIPELQAGIWHEWLDQVGVLPTNHYRLAALSAIMAGASGWNWYMLANRDNWYQSPINEWGRQRSDLFEVFRQVVSLYRNVDPPALERLTGMAVTLDPLQRATDRPGQDLLQALYQADLDYEFFDLSQDRPCRQPVLFYAGGSWLSVQGQQRLYDYVAGGGHLICLGAYPNLDDRLLPHNRLGIPAPEGVLGGGPDDLRFSFAPAAWLSLENGATGGTVFESPWSFNYSHPPGKALPANRRVVQSLTEELTRHNSLVEGIGFIPGYTQTIGGGRLTVLGVVPSSKLILAILAALEIQPPSRSLTPGVQTGLFRNGRSLFLLATNPNPWPIDARVELDPDCSPRATLALDLVTGERLPLFGGGSRQVVAPLKPQDAALIRID
jgi:hypothetical protein